MQEPQGSLREKSLWALLRCPSCARSSVWARTEPAYLQIATYSFPKPPGLPTTPTVHPGAKDPLKAVGTVNTPRGGWFMEDLPQLFTCWILHVKQCARYSCKAQAAKSQPAPSKACRQLQQHGMGCWDSKCPQLYSHGE